MMTKVQSAKARVRAAQAELDAAHVALARSTKPIEASIRRRRATWIVAGGLVSGLALSWLPPRLWAKIGALVGGGSAMLARSMLTPMIAGALMSRENKAPESASDST